MAAVESKSERAYHWLRDRITDGSYTPGHRLVLRSIADDLGMSVVPVREAIRLLQAEGIVTVSQNIGAQVALIPEDECGHIMQALGVVEGVAIALSSRLLTPADLDRAQEINDRMIALLDDFDPRQFSRLNEEFHAALYAKCPNPHLLEQVHRGSVQLASIRDSVFAPVVDRGRHSVVEHQRILDLINSRADLIDIEMTVRNHRLRTMDLFLATRR